VVQKKTALMMLHHRLLSAELVMTFWGRKATAAAVGLDEKRTPIIALGEQVADIRR
jgi:hypothetical protein